MKKYIFTIGMILSLSACNNKIQNNEPINISETIDKSIITKYNLPPEPNVGNPGFSTILGVDSNGIRGRDDVEREIALEFHDNEDKIHKLHEISGFHLEAVKAMANNDVESFKKFAGEYTMYKRCYVFSFADSGAEDIGKLKSFLYDESREDLTGSVSYSDSTYSSLSKTLQYCKDNGFNIYF
tara:strand:- start:2839 stop:3387 length:549 start_codon:yes stop_codon:yes gene_type:complete